MTPNAAAPAPAGYGGTAVPIKIVLADDHHLVRQGIRCMLEGEEDFEVVGETADGLKVTGLVERLKPRVLIVTVALPGLNGIDVTRVVRQRRPSTAVIVLSAIPSERWVVEALRAGASAFVVQQARGMELVRAIRKAAVGQRYLSEPFSASGVQPWLERAQRRHDDDPYDRLTPREREVLQLVAEGYSSAGIASRLDISPRTAESHRGSVMRKLGLGSQVDLVRYALARGILSLPSDIPPTSLRRPGRPSAN
jgi:DNA-binding NarL/FixJ family response regulator